MRLQRAGSTAVTPLIATDSVADLDIFLRDSETHPVRSAVDHGTSFLCTYVIFNHPPPRSRPAHAIQHSRMSCIQSVKDRGKEFGSTGAQ